MIDRRTLSSTPRTGSLKLGVSTKGSSGTVESGSMISVVGAVGTAKTLSNEMSAASVENGFGPRRV